MYSFISSRAKARALAAFVALSLATTAFPTSGIAQGNPNDLPLNPNVTICHATQSEVNPYTNPTVDARSIVNLPNGHNDHDDGGVNDAGDIIPPFDYDFGEGVQSYPGKNWEEPYLSIYENDCVVPPATGELTVVKVVEGGDAQVSDFTLKVDDEEVESGETNEFEVGNYVVSEEGGPEGYTATFSGDCDADGNVSIAEDDDKTCTITNTFEEADTTGVLVVVKQVVSGDASPSDFTLNVLDNTQTEVESDPGSSEGTAYELEAGSYTVTEDNFTGYTASFNSCGSDGNVTVSAGATTTCTVQNRAIPDDTATGTIIIKKTTAEAGAAVEFDYTGDLGNFSLFGNTEESFDVATGSYTITEEDESGWELASLSCDVADEQVNGSSVTVTLDEGETITCEYGNREVLQCVDEMPGWADGYEDVAQGDQKDGDDVLAGRSNPDDALGEADWSPGDSDGFFSLGMGGSIVLTFNKFVPDEDGDDISVHEATNGTYPLEKVKVEVSQNGSEWEELTEEARNDSNEGGDGVTLLDISETGLAWIKYVRLTDTTDPGIHNNDADGFDLDAVDAVKELCDEPEGEEPFCPAEGVNLFENSSFETPEVTDAAGWDIFESGTATLAWIVDWFTDNFSGTPDPENGWIELHAGVNGWDSSEGEQHAELDSDWQGPGGPSGEEASIQISQEVPTVAGIEYTIEWDFSPRPNTGAGENVLEVLVDGVVVETNSAAGGGDVNWQTDSYTFTADDDEVVVTFRDGGTPNSVGTFLDNVYIYCGEREVEPDPGTIIVAKEVTEGSDTQTSFTFTPSWGANFQLADGQSTSSELDAGTYSVSETVPNDWNLVSAICVHGDQSTSSPDSIDLDENETVTCTFTNDEDDGGGGGNDDGTIIVEKEVTEGSDQNTTFTFTASWNEVFGLEHGESEDESLEAGTYSVAETSIPEDWTLVSAVCIHGDQSTSSPESIELSANETVTCTFTNDEDDDGGGGGDPDPGTIIVAKEVTEGSDTQTSFTFTPSWGANFQLADGQSTSSELDAGTYSVSETVPNDWNLVSAICVHGDQSTSSPDSIDLDENETVTCTFTNDEDDGGGGGQTDGSISGTKYDWSTEEQLEGWVIFIDEDGDQELDDGEASTTTNGDGEYTFTGLVDGSYSVCEVNEEGWVQRLPDTDNGCHTVVIDGGNDSTNNDFWNEEEEEEGLRVVLEKKFSGDDQGFESTQFSFRIFGDNGVDTTVPHEGAIDLLPGTYEVSEIVPEGFNPDDWTIQWSGPRGICVDETAATGTLIVTEEDVEQLTDNVRCVADNQYKPGDNGGGGGQLGLACGIDSDDLLVDSDDEFELSWTSSGKVDNAFINAGIGSVAANGALTTSIDDDTTFVLTVQTFNDEDEVIDEETCTVEVLERGGGGGGTRTNRSGGGGSDNSGGGGSSPEGEVLGEQVSIIPLGAANAGAGGAALPNAFVLFALVLAFATLRATRTNEDA